MAEPSPPKTLRPCGNIEIYSTSRHALGIYRCVVVSARYTSPPPAARRDEAIFTALGQLVARHPMLRVGVVGEGTNSPQYTHIPEVDLNKHVVFRTLPEGDDYEAGLGAIHAWCHDQLWTDLETLPPWRIIIVRPEAESDSDNDEEDDGSPEYEDVVLYFHHVLMDGTSAKNFHEQLASLLNEDQDEDAEHVLEFPEPPVLPEPLDHVMAYTNSIGFMGHLLWSELAPSFLKPAPPAIWAGEPVDFARPHRAQVLPVDIPAPVVASLIVACRQHSASLTTLLHALCLASLSRRLPAAAAAGFKASTPMNARPFLSSSLNPATKDTFRVAISITSHDYPAAVAEALRQPGADLDALVWQAAKATKDDIRARVAALPADDPISLLGYIPDWEAFWKKKDGQARDCSWEISNIGVLSERATQRQAPRRISRVLFTNGIMVASGPFSISVATAPNGALTAGISWCEHVVSDELMTGLAADLVSLTSRLHRTGKFAP